MNISSSPYRIPKAQAKAPKPEPKLEYPSQETEPARNGRPVVLLHGTIVEKDGACGGRALQELDMLVGVGTAAQTAAQVRGGD